MLIKARLDGIEIFYRTTTRDAPHFTRYTSRAADIPSTIVDGVIRCLQVKVPAGKFWREDEPEPDTLEGSTPREGEHRRAPVEFSDPYPEDT